MYRKYRLSGRSFVKLSSEFFEKISRAGAQAPSGDNLQPWSFSSDGDTLLVKHDPQRDLSLFNVQHLASFIALGAVLENISIAATNESYQAEFELFPDGQSVDLIARVTFSRGIERDSLADFLFDRCTNRKPYSSQPLRPEIFRNLDAEAARFPTAALYWVKEKNALGRLGNIVSQADRFLFENPQIHNHFFSTLRWSQAEVESTRDGLPIRSLELGRVGSLAFRCLKPWSVVNFLNSFGFSRATANHSLALMRRCSAGGLLTVPDASLHAFLQAGRVFQRIWLQATKENLATQPMTAVIFLQLRSRLAEYNGLTQEQIRTVNELRRDLETFFALPADRVPAMVFRIGYAPGPTARTIRRGVTDKLEMKKQKRSV